MGFIVVGARPVQLTVEATGGSATQLPGIVLTPERQIATEGGAVFHAIKKSSPGFEGFGEAYFSFVDRGKAKGWKKHLRMTLNLTVPCGGIRFFLAKDEAGQPADDVFWIDLSTTNYMRLTVTPGYWMAFAGLLDGPNLVMNVADIEHDSEESVSHASELLDLLEASGWSSAE